MTGCLTAVLVLGSAAALGFGAYRGYRSHGDLRRSLAAPVVFAVVMALLGPGRRVIPGLFEARELFAALRLLVIGAAYVWGAREIALFAAAPAERPTDDDGAGPARPRLSRLGLISLVLGLQCVAVVCFFVLTAAEVPISTDLQMLALPFVFTSPIALGGAALCGHLSLADVKRGRSRGRWAAAAGLWLGYGSLAAALAGAVYLFVAWLSSMSGWAG